MYYFLTCRLQSVRLHLDSASFEYLAASEAARGNQNRTQ